MANDSLKFENFECELFHGQRISVTGEIAASERVVLRGPSGCGKTTLLKFIAGLFPPRSGKIMLGPSELDPGDVKQIRPGLVFQGGALFEHLSVFDNCRVAVDYNPQYSSWSHELKEKLIFEKLSEVSMRDRAESVAMTLSGGEKQRVALVRCLLSSPKFLLLDEPLSALDPSMRQSMQQLLLNLLAKNPLPTLIVTHDENEAKVLGTRVLAWPASGSNGQLLLSF